MEVKSTEEFVRILTERSVILGPQPRPGEPPRISSARWLDEQGCRNLLRDMETTDVKKFGFSGSATYPVGHLAIAKERLKEAEHRWEVWNKAQRKQRKEPYAEFAEAINRCKAAIIILEREAAELRKALAEADKKRATNEQRLRESSERRAERRRNV